MTISGKLLSLPARLLLCGGYIGIDQVSDEIGEKGGENYLRKLFVSGVIFFILVALFPGMKAFAAFVPSGHLTGTTSSVHLNWANYPNISDTDSTTTATSTVSSGNVATVIWPFSSPIKVDSFILDGVMSNFTNAHCILYATLSTGVDVELGRLTGTRDLQIHTITPLMSVTQIYLVAEITFASATSNVTVYSANVYGDSDAPSVPTGLAGVRGDSFVDLSWNAVSAPDLAKYYIYKDSVKIAETTAPSYKVIGLTNGTSYLFQVAAVDASGNISGYSTAVSATPRALDTTPPAAPLNFRVELERQGKIIFAWNANAEPDVVSYKMYMDNIIFRPGLTGVTNEVATAPITPGTHSFYLTAVDDSGNESAVSNSLSVTLAGSLSVNFVPNATSIVVQVIGGVPPYTLNWIDTATAGAALTGTDTFSASAYTIPGVLKDTIYTVTITASNGDTITSNINTGSIASFVPPVFPDPVSVFQRMIDSFGTSGSISIAIISAAVALGVIVILGLFGWRLAKRWLAATK